MFRRIKENGLSFLSIIVLSLLFAVALLSTILILPLAIIVAAIFSIKQMLKWRKKQSDQYFNIGKVTFMKEPLSVWKVIQITFPKRGFKKAG